MACYLGRTDITVAAACKPTGMFFEHATKHSTSLIKFAELLPPLQIQKSHTIRKKLIRFCLRPGLRTHQRRTSKRITIRHHTYLISQIKTRKTRKYWCYNRKIPTYEKLSIDERCNFKLFSFHPKFVGVQRPPYCVIPAELLTATNVHHRHNPNMVSRKRRPLIYPDSSVTKNETTDPM
jgi:hypothetical protein